MTTEAQLEALDRRVHELEHDLSALEARHVKRIAELERRVEAQSEMINVMGQGMQAMKEILQTIKDIMTS